MKVEAREPLLKRANRAAANLRRMRPETYNQAALNAAANLLERLVLRAISDEHTFNHVAYKRGEAEAALQARLESSDEATSAATPATHERP